MKKRTAGTYESVALELEKKAKRIRSLSEVLEQMVDAMVSNMPYDRDTETGDIKEDPDTGDFVHREPTEDDWGYDRYIAWNEAIEAVEAYIQKLSK